jgi:hypothetical protein
MGLDTNGIKFLFACHKRGISLKNTMMIGRQIINTEASELEEDLKGFNLFKSEAETQRIMKEKRGYAEPLLEILGAEHIDCLDYSDYEGANILHDMNLPIPDKWKAKYDLVLESGSLEHIFNFPVSMANCMDMTALNGHLMVITPVNNIMGHGFYQFSPEVFYRVLGKSNGFQIEQMLIFEYAPELKWYSVKDPRHVKQRVELMNSSATYLCVLAKRTDLVPINQSFPQQSDYEDAWAGVENYYSKLAQDRDSIDKQFDPAPTKKLIKKILPNFFIEVYRAYKQAQKEKFNPKFYTEVNIWDLK